MVYMGRGLDGGEGAGAGAEEGVPSPPVEEEEEDEEAAPVDDELELDWWRPIGKILLKGRRAAGAGMDCRATAEAFNTGCCCGCCCCCCGWSDKS